MLTVVPNVTKPTFISSDNKSIANYNYSFI